jgi:hypothetical protein
MTDGLPSSVDVLPRTRRSEHPNPLETAQFLGPELRTDVFGEQG